MQRAIVNPGKLLTLVVFRAVSLSCSDIGDELMTMNGRVLESVREVHPLYGRQCDPTIVLELQTEEISPRPPFSDSMRYFRYATPAGDPWRCVAYNSEEVGGVDGCESGFCILVER